MYLAEGHLLLIFSVMKLSSSSSSLMNLKGFGLDVYETVVNTTNVPCCRVNDCTGPAPEIQHQLPGPRLFSVNKKYL